MLRKHYVEYFYPGSFFEETSCKEIPSHELKHVDPPSSCFAFKFYDIEYEMATTDSGKRVEVNHKRANESGRYFIDGEVFTTEELEAWAKTQSENHDILISNCRCNGGKVVRSRLGNWQVFREHDLVVSL